MPEPTSSPTETPAAPVANQQDRAAIEAEVLQRVFDGKYKTVDDAKKGHWELNNYAAQAHTQLQERANPAALAAARPNPMQRLKDEAYIPEDAFTEAVNALIAPRLAEAFQPIVGALQARQAMAAEAPEYIPNESAILNWLQTNPKVAGEVKQLNDKGLYELAAKHGYREWKIAQPIASPGNPEAKAQAALPNAGVQRAQDQGTNRGEIMQQALAYGFRTGDRRPALSMVFPDFEAIVPEHLKQR